MAWQGGRTGAANVDWRFFLSSRPSKIAFTRSPQATRERSQAAQRGPIPSLRNEPDSSHDDTESHDVTPSNQRAKSSGAAGPHALTAQRQLSRAPLPRSRELSSLAQEKFINSHVMTADNPPLRQDNGPTCTRGEPHFRHAWSRNVNNRVPIASRQPRWRHDSKEAARTCAHA